MKCDLVAVINKLLQGSDFELSAFVFSPAAADLLGEWMIATYGLDPSYSIVDGGPVLGYETRVNPYLLGYAVRPVVKPLFLSELKG